MAIDFQRSLNWRFTKHLTQLLHQNITVICATEFTFRNTGKPKCLLNRSLSFNSVLFIRLKYHIIQHVQANQKFICNFCGLQFKYKNILNNHMLSHIEESPFKCNFCCDRSFKTVGLLSSHIIAHQNQKPKKSYDCKFCAKKFNQSSSLRSHERVHTLEHPYTCEICSKKFKNWSNWKDHYRLHTGKRLNNVSS